MEKKFSDNSGGNRNLLYSGQEISPDNKFNSTIAFNGSTDFAYIPIIGDTYKISTSEVTRFDLLHAWWLFDENGTDRPEMKEMKRQQVFQTQRWGTRSF